MAIPWLRRIGGKYPIWDTNLPRLCRVARVVLSLAIANDLHLHPCSGSLNIEIDEELGMFTTRPPHGYSPQLLSELGTAELFVLSSLRLWFLSHCDREHETVRPRIATVPAAVGSSLLH